MRGVLRVARQASGDVEKGRIMPVGDEVSRNVRRYREVDLGEAIAVFRDAIYGIAAADYDLAEREAWAAAGDDVAGFGRRLARGYTIVAEDEKGVVALGQLDPADHVELLYCHSRGRGQGFGSAILDQLEAEARRQGQRAVRAEVSLTARRVFERHAYEVLGEEVVQRGAVRLRRYRMRKALG